MTETNGQTRREMIRISGMVGAGVGLMTLADGALARPMRGGAQPGGDVAVLQGALALEHGGIAAYRIAAGSGLLSAGTIQVATVFLGHHEGHRDALARLITQTGGHPVEPKSDAEYISALNIAALKSEGDVVKFAAGLEQGAANAYIGQISALKDAKLTHLFGQLGGDEAVHWALLNSAAGGAVAKAPFLFS